MASNSNPFAALLKKNQSGIDKQIIEEIFLFTLRKDAIISTSTKQPLLYLADVVVDDDGSETEMSEEMLSHTLFERLMLTNPKDYLLNGEDFEESNENNQAAIMSDCILYLHRAFVCCETLRLRSTDKAAYCDLIRMLIITNASTCMRQPDLFPGRAIYDQWKELMEASEDTETNLTMEFLVQCIEKIYFEEEPLEALGALKGNFYPLLSKLLTDIAQANLVTLNRNIFWLLNYFVSDRRLPQMGEVFLDFITPNPNANGKAYMGNLLGQLLCISILPKYQNGSYEYFNDAVVMESKLTDAALWECLANHQKSIYHLIKQLLMQDANNKSKMLQWLSKCFHANKSRTHLWNNLNAGGAGGGTGSDNILQLNASDAFMNGITSVLLRLCAPLCSPTLKVLLVDASYCAVPEEERQQKCVNMIKMSEETCLLPYNGNDKRPTASKFNFVTELFFLTHKAYELSYRVCIERFLRISRDMHYLQSTYNDAAYVDPNSDLAKNLQRMLKQQMQQYLCFLNTLTEPENDTATLKIFEASAIWLIEIALTSRENYEKMLDSNEFAPRICTNTEIPDKIPFISGTLCCIPENIIDNIVVYLSFIQHCPQPQSIQMYPSAHDAFFKMIILFMGNSELVKNPHLRAKLAEALEFFIPKQGTISNHSNVFDTHPDRTKIVRSLLNVFVSIEVTGQSVQFEQKLNYRRPMYAIMEYLWTKEEYVQTFKKLAEEAEANMESIEPPLFLRFINLLINDAIFLLDESLNNLQQIRQLQEAQRNGEWSRLPESESQQHQSNLHQLGLLARFDNILGRYTINFLKLLTSEIKSIFCHNSMVERVTAMLNYFLLNLVGPQKDKFKVKDKKEFDFDPASTVLDICRIYINLSDSQRFCLAVSQDGRSYSSQLFSYAENILIRIGGGQLIGELSDFAGKVQIIEQQYKEEQEFMADAPDEYLDPIMSTLMTDPVILPDSKVTVDRTTIARHLLSDQTDPFNRAPLTMDKVKSNKALKEEIDNWIAGKREAASKAK